MLSQKNPSYCIPNHRELLSTYVDMTNYIPNARPRYATPFPLSIAGFSLNTLGRKMASCDVILLPKALSTFAPRASLLKLSLFSAEG